MTNEDKDLKLRECPFCGGEANEEGQHVFCSDCGAMPVIFDQTKDSLEEHRKLWNTRATPQQPSEPLKELDEEKVYNAILDAFYPTTYWTDGLGRALAKAVCSKFGQPSEKKSKAEAIHEAIRNADVGDDIVIHNEDMSVWCILNLVTREHPERESNGKDRS